MAKKTLELSDTTVYILDDGEFVTDAGNLFGGTRKARIKGAMRPVLVESGDDLVLLDAGFGPELPESLVGRYELRQEKNLVDHLEEAGYAVEDVTHVVLSHLDPDHVGWALRPRGFPNAMVYAQRAAVEEAKTLPEESSRREIAPIFERGVDEGWCELLDGDTEVVAGVRAEVRNGHAEGHQVFWIGTDENLALFTADLAPAKIWLDPDLIAGVDTDPEAARKNRIEVLSTAADRNAPTILYHEPKDFLVRIRRKDEGFEGVALEE